MPLSFSRGLCIVVVSKILPDRTVERDGRGFGGLCFYWVPFLSPSQTVSPSPRFVSEQVAYCSCNRSDGLGLLRRSSIAESKRMNGTTHNQSLLPTPLTPLAYARGVKGSLAALGAAEFNR